MDFVRDTLAEGQPFRVQSVLDQWSRQSPLLEVGTRMSGVTRGQAFDRVWDGVREPRSILVVHETKFQSRALDTYPKIFISFEMNRRNPLCDSLS